VFGEGRAGGTPLPTAMAEWLQIFIMLLRYTGDLQRILCIGVARIFLGMHFSSQKVDDLFLVVALKTHAKTTQITSATVYISPIS